VRAPATHPKPASRLRALGRLIIRPSEAWLALRVVGWMVLLRPLKRMLPLPKLVQLMWTSPRVSARNTACEQRSVAVVSRLSRASGGNCLERSLILYRYLSHAGAQPRLVVGMARPKEYLGHVWVTVDGHPLLETTETLRGYATVTAFGRGGRRLE
jgi:hypothetical protein